MSYTIQSLVLNTVRTMSQPVTPTAVRRRMVEMGYKRIPMTMHISNILKRHCTKDYEDGYVIYYMEEDE